ncbi:hypothetical protein ASZ90_000115 [hydrocarbon metagenome]|uniref:Uncharacterized protein n=1 Tax=hydrocarbon metagenome TaxID=938273 RepID=A0A0W8GA69_9ZZZZ
MEDVSPILAVFLPGGPAPVKLAVRNDLIHHQSVGMEKGPKLAGHIGRTFAVPGHARENASPSFIGGGCGVGIH